MRIVVLALVLTLFGCAAASVPPRGEDGGWRSFYVVNHGLHTGLVIAARPDLLQALPALAEAFGDGDFVEFGWGDEHFYRAPQATLSLALRALFGSTATVLHVVKIVGDPRRSFAASEVIEVRVTEDGYRRLLAFVVGTFTRSAAGTLAALGPGLYGESRFYQAEGSYSLFYTCNTWVAEALAASSCPMSPAVAVTAGSVMSQLRRASATGAACLAR
ncbi:DUF2459 domain-containing protein [Pseudomonas sp. R5(2019)]|uniref:DUF2459 domain-containing protein n=1 Tax=Pseudomonas sp. R5(2019) TaxID=2697566 RepID=UPI00141251EE|nr:DUF2459 domain-containing protein [Pseudomonas sp. R5(2019)]NBA95729.1 DUF2459 domain-containing protein [Pseudomonas sp. R5(2019)]